MSGQRWRCTQCGTRTGSVLKVCAPCLSAGIDPLTGGRWVSVEGIQRWRPWTAEECAERTRQALRALPARRDFDELQQARKRLHVLVGEHRSARKEVA